MARQRITNIICRDCGESKRRDQVRLNPNGTIKDRRCGPCRMARFRQVLAKSDKYNARRIVSRTEYIKHKKTTCQKCGFIPQHPVQLDVDHMDGNVSNNDPSNLMTLCANCHRLKTLSRAEGFYRLNAERHKTAI